MSFAQSLRISQALATNMSKTEYAINSIAHASESSAKNIEYITMKITGTADIFTKRMDNAASATEKFNTGLLSSLNITRVFNRNMSDTSDTTRRFRDNLQSTESVFGTLIRHFGGLDKLGREVDNFSAASNQMIRLSGMRGDTVREFRSEIMSTVKDMNMEMGSIFSPQESYKQIISISQGVTSNLEALEEMTRPLLLTQETLDVNINSIADLFNRFYTRYSFSSENMESVLDEIRGNTAGNSANAEATLQNIKSLENWINVIAGNDNQKREDMIAEISHYTSWLESMNIDSAPYTKYLEAIAYGDWGENKELLNIFSRQGVTGTQAQDMARNGQWQDLTIMMTEGMRDMISTVQDSRSLGKALDNLGIDRSTAMANWTTLDSAGFVSFEDFLKENDANNKASAAELVEDKYVSAADKTNNWLEQIYSKIASIQEHIGIGVSDLAIGAFLASRLGMGGVGAGGSLIGGALTRGANTVGANLAVGAVPVVGNMASTNLALGAGIAGAGAGIGLGIYNGIQAKDLMSEGLYGAGTLSALGSVAGGVGAGALALGAGPVGWIALLGSGVAALMSKWVENATEFSGNAKVVETQIQDIGKSLQDENKQRLADISDLSYRFSQESDIDKQRLLLEQSNLFDHEDLYGKNTDQLRDLIDSYKDAVSAMDEVTEGVLDLAETYYKEQQNIQQKDFIKALRGENLSGDQMKDIASLLQTSVTDEDLQKKFTKYLSDDKVTKSEFNDLLYGGKNSLFDKVNMTDKSLDVSGMSQVAGYLGWDMDFVSSDNAGEVVRLYNDFANATSDAARDRAWEAIKDSGLEDQIRNIYGNQLSVYGYSDGTNYIPKTQLALLHEGEAVVPKKYNPAANAFETEKTTEYVKSLVEELRDIKEFLAEWKIDNERKGRLSEVRARHSSSRNFVSQYMQI